MARGQVTQATKRVFLAFPLAEYFSNEISSFLEQLRRIAGIKWVKPDEVHITLHFFGERDEAAVQKIRSIVPPIAGQHAPFQITLEHLGFFPHPAQPRVIWLGVAGDSDRLVKLQGELEEKFKATGFSIEERSFKPHATLGRLRDCLQTNPQWPVFSRTRTKTVDRLLLYASHLNPKPGQPRYEILETFLFSKHPSA